MGAPLLAAPHREPLAHRRQQLADADRAELQREPSVLCPGEHEQVLGDSHQTVGLLPRRVQRRIEVLPGLTAAQGQVGLGPEDRERRSESGTASGLRGAMSRARGSLLGRVPMRVRLVISLARR